MKLQASTGTKHVSFAGVQYEVAADGTVDVPDAALEPLLAHGLTLAGAGEPARKPPGLDGHGSESYGGEPGGKGPPAPEDARAPRPAGVLRKGA